MFYQNHITCFGLLDLLSGVYGHEMHRPMQLLLQRFNLRMRLECCTVWWINWSETCDVVHIKYSCVDWSFGVWVISGHKGGPQLQLKKILGRHEIYDVIPVSALSPSSCVSSSHGNIICSRPWSLSKAQS